MQRTSISWCLGPDGQPGYSWNPFAGCSAKKPSKGCDHCYAKRLAATRLAHLPAYKGLAYVDDSEDTDSKRVVDRYHWTGEVRFFPERLAEPLRLRKPAGIFVCDMGDLFHESLTNEQIAAVFGVMAACPQHRFYVCTKRAKRRREWFEWAGCGTRTRLAASLVLCNSEIGRKIPLDLKWPLPNVIQLSTVCTQAEADRDIEDLIATPAAVRGLSIEPLLEDIKLHPGYLGCKGYLAESFGNPLIHWIVVGGESGPNARPCHVEWIRSIVRQCREAGVPCWTKQLGSNSIGDGYDLSDETARELDAAGCETLHESARLPLRDRAGADMDEWPADLRVRQMPEVRR